MTPQQRGVIRILRRARSLIRAGWVQRSYAVGKSGRTVSETSKYACKFCSVGAISRATSDLNLLRETYNHGERRLNYVAEDFVRGFVGENVSVWNDRPNTRKRDVLKAFGHAIEIAKESYA